MKNSFVVLLSPWQQNVILSCPSARLIAQNERCVVYESTQCFANIRYSFKIINIVIIGEKMINILRGK